MPHQLPRDAEPLLTPAEVRALLGLPPNSGL